MVNVSGDVSPATGDSADKPKEMLSLTTDDRGKQIVRINSSSLDILLTCQRKAMYTLYRGLTARMQSPATLFGTAIHAALEEFYRTPRDKRSLPKGIQKKLEMLPHDDDGEDHVVLNAGRRFLEAANNALPVDEHEKRSVPCGLWLLSHYFERYINDPFVVHVDDNGPIVERPFSFLLIENNDMEVHYFGTIDCVLRNEQTGKLLVTDHKTTSMLGNDFLNRLKPNHQYTGYLLGARNALEIDTNEFMVNAIGVKPKPKTARAQPPQFPRQITKRDKEDYADFTATVDWAVRNYVEQYHSAEWAMGSANACAMYGGCQYLDVCRAPTQIRENIIEANFKKRNEVEKGAHDAATQ